MFSSNMLTESSRGNIGLWPVKWTNHERFLAKIDLVVPLAVCILSTKAALPLLTNLLWGVVFTFSLGHWQLEVLVNSKRLKLKIELKKNSLLMM
jgi:hypothetical protein